MDKLPNVAGQYEGSLADLERRARFYIGEQLECPNPDNALISVLSDTVRVCRELAGQAAYSAYLRAQIEKLNGE